MAETTFTLGTHNLHDRAGVPTFFADVVIFTEAIAPTILALARQKAALAVGRLRGYRVAVCRQQPDLVVAYRRRKFKRRGPISYERFVDGVPEVTPHRGTAWLPLELRALGLLVPVVFEHRINAWFEPFKRGEPIFRARMWRKHTSGTLDLLERLRDSLGVAVAGGDVNTPTDKAGYSMSGSIERGEHFDRLALVHGDDSRRRWSLGAAEYLSRKGSDHPRLRVTVTLKEN